jgi:hypothetical protein
MLIWAPEQAQSKETVFKMRTDITAETIGSDIVTHVNSAMTGLTDHHGFAIYKGFHGAFASTHALENRMVLVTSAPATTELAHAILFVGASEECVWDHHETNAVNRRGCA